MSLRGWLDASPIASVVLALMRDATGRDRPHEVIAPTRPAALQEGARLGFWALTAGCGTSTTAALVAHRSASGGNPPLLVDLDRWAPSLALRAALPGVPATVADALLRPGREGGSLSRWSDLPFLPAAPGLHRIFDEQVVQLVERAAGGRSVVLDLGAGSDALDPSVLSTLRHLLVVTGPRVAQLQAAFCAVALLRDAPCPVGLVVTGAGPEDADAIAARLPWPLRGAIPNDPHLASDTFAARAPTLRAIDQLIRALA